MTYRANNQYVFKREVAGFVGYALLGLLAPMAMTLFAFIGCLVKIQDRAGLSGETPELPWWVDAIGHTFILMAVLFGAYLFLSWNHIFAAFATVGLALTTFWIRKTTL